MLSLTSCCDLTDEQKNASSPVCIASRDKSYLISNDELGTGLPSALQPYESLRKHCKALNHEALARLNLQMALYVHPVIRGDELALSAAIQAGKISQPTDTLESRHRAEAELRSIFTMFISPVISPRVTGLKEVDQELYRTLSDIMHVTSRELDRYSGHLRQFIVDDKGSLLRTWKAKCVSLASSKISHTMSRLRRCCADSYLWSARVYFSKHVSLSQQKCHAKALFSFPIPLTTCLCCLGSRIIAFQRRLLSMKP
jgi:hypothetical protein